MTRAREKLTAACLCFAVALPAFAQGDARMWLDRMENAVEYLNYKGVFVRIVSHADFDVPNEDVEDEMEQDDQATEQQQQ